MPSTEIIQIKVQSLLNNAKKSLHDYKSNTSTTDNSLISQAHMAHFELFTDGACSGNPGPGGWAFVLRGTGISGDLERSGAEPQTTNNRMELLAVIRGLESLPTTGRVRVVSDSEYVVKGLKEWLDGWKARGWRTAAKKPVKNDDLWRRLDELRATHQLAPEWIRGHNEHPENSRCDALAVAAIDTLRGNSAHR